MRIPLATYRLQFSSSFRFNDAKALIPYLSRLGVSDVYASPILKARPGSTHGYDVTDPGELNPELGTQKDFDALVAEVRAHGMGWLQDIV
ncbi:MAG: alpha-amylase family glycosyl hydrolase, partial [Solirubrobacterales bacterium]